MNVIERNIMAGSVIKTIDKTLWYSCGNWQLSGISNAFPCIPGYVLESILPPEVKVTKRIVSDGMEYAKIFGYRGLSFEFHKEWLYPRMGSMIHNVSLGRMVFVKKDKIVSVKSPIQFREKLLSELIEAREIYTELCQIMEIPIECVGISGSVLALESISWRHETDFSVYGEDACKKAFAKINESRRNGTFSEDTIPPYHMPFKYRGKWFDPHFSVLEREKYLHGAEVLITEQLSEKVFTITNDENGLFFPVVYLVNKEEKLVSFRSSHRGLYRKGDKVRFSSISKGKLIFSDGSTEEAYVVANNEWGEKL